MKNSTTISKGPTRFDPRGVTLQKAGHHGQARNNVSSFLYRVLPIPASRPMSSGHFMCMAPLPTEDTFKKSGCSSGRAKVRSGWHPWGRAAPQTIARPNNSGVSWASLGGLRGLSGRRCCPRGPPESSDDACQTLRSVWSGGQVCPKAYESLSILNIASKR